MAGAVVIFNKFKRRFQWAVNIYHWMTGWWFVLANGCPGRRLVTIGVTGTDGKTTTCYLIYEMLKAAGFKAAMISTVAAYVGEEEIDIGFHVTNPDARQLQELLGRIVRRGFSHLVMEVTSHGLDQNRLVGVGFHAGVLTNITHEHLDYHKTFERYREAKAKLISNVQYSVLNRDDPSFAYLRSKARGQVIPYGKGHSFKVSPFLAGGYNLYNIGAAEAVAKLLGVGSQEIVGVVKNFAGVPGRMEEVKMGQKFRVIVDFAHTPNALEQVLRELKTQKSKLKKLIVVFGCAGERDHTKRPMMGEIATRLADRVIITAEDPRTESLDMIYGQIVSRIPPSSLPPKLGGRSEEGGTRVLRIDDRRKAIETAIETARLGDIVVVTGKGHEKSMCFGTTEYPWSDREAVRGAIEQKLSV